MDYTLLSPSEIFNFINEATVYLNDQIVKDISKEFASLSGKGFDSWRLEESDTGYTVQLLGDYTVEWDIDSDRLNDHSLPTDSKDFFDEVYNVCMNINRLLNTQYNDFLISGRLDSEVILGDIEPVQYSSFDM